MLAHLTAPGTSRFGTSVALDGSGASVAIAIAIDDDLALVGAPGHDRMPKCLSFLNGERR